MPCSRTVSGLRFEEACDSFTDLQYINWGEIGGSVALSIDEAVKKEGTGSFKAHLDRVLSQATGQDWLACLLSPKSATEEHYLLPAQYGDRLHFWHKANATGTHKMYATASGSPGDFSLFSYEYIQVSKIGNEDWALKKQTLTDPPGGDLWNPGPPPLGLQQMFFFVVFGDGPNTVLGDQWFDHIVLAASQYLIVGGLYPSQKVELYRASDNVKIGTQTCAAGQTQVTFDVDNEDFPLYLYLIIYATDGSTVLEVTSNYRMCGGDIWIWTPPYGTMTMQSADFIVNCGPMETEEKNDVGHKTGTPGNLNTGYLYSQKFIQDDREGVLDSISFFANINTNVGVTLYSHNIDRPGVPLTSKYVTAISGAPKFVTVPMVGADRITLQPNTAYWIVFEMQANGGVAYSGSGGNRYFISGWTYGTAFPNPWTGGTGSATYQALVYWTYLVTYYYGASTTITATLLTQAGAPAPGKTIYFTTSLGSVSPESDVTDDNGQATTILMSTQHGIATVKGLWLGDVYLPAAIGWVMVQIFYEAEVGDASKKFQLYIQGKPLVYNDGTYALANELKSQAFRIIIPAWDPDIIRRGIVSIYRRGVLEYRGTLTGRERALSTNQVVLTGTDSKTLLETRVVCVEDYLTKTIVYILSDLFTKYPCGLTLGAIGDYPSPLTVTLSDEPLVSSISRLMNLIGWIYRVNLDLSIDFRDAFGASRPDIAFVEGVNLLDAKPKDDYTQLANHIRMRGALDKVETVFDAASIEEVGLLEDVAFQKSISDDSLLVLAANAELNRRLQGQDSLPIEVKDDYDVGSWKPDDWVTVTSSHLGLSGEYKVVKIVRDMKDPYYARVDLINKADIEFSDLFQELRRQLKDLNTKTTI